ncbi:hypothetical protein Tco_0801209 [Tanacetum coccineum]|uniref:Uncharacterized protein n=1 Tax=Tanacetum coccineum TaxID=301880 RepID=A0ABQ4ZXM7_9ASTR
MWKRTNDVPPLPPLVRRLPGRPQKAIIKVPYESSGSHTSKVGRTMTCINCWQKGHNRATYTADPVPKPTVDCASRGRGRGRCGIGNEASGSGMGGIGEASGGGYRQATLSEEVNAESKDVCWWKDIRERS